MNIRYFIMSPIMLANNLTKIELANSIWVGEQKRSLGEIGIGFGEQRLLCGEQTHEFGEHPYRFGEVFKFQQMFRPKSNQKCVVNPLELREIGRSEIRNILDKLFCYKLYQA